MTLDGVYERPPRPPAAPYAALLGQEVVGVSPAAAIREEQAARGALVKIEPGHIARADALVLHLRALVCNTTYQTHGAAVSQVSAANKQRMLKHSSVITPSSLLTIVKSFEDKYSCHLHSRQPAQICAPAGIAIISDQILPISCSWCSSLNDVRLDISLGSPHRFKQPISDTKLF